MRNSFGCASRHSLVKFPWGQSPLDRVGLRDYPIILRARRLKRAGKEAGLGRGEQRESKAAAEPICRSPGRP
jgi:hypothetical protein